MTKVSSLTSLAGSAVDPAADLFPIVDMSETGTARNKKIPPDEVKIALDLDTSASPQFTALNLGHASDTTITRVSAGVVAIEGVNIVTTAGGVTFAADIVVPDEVYDATNWDGSLEVPTKNAVRDKIESISAGSGIAVEDEGVSEGTGITTLNFTGAGCSVTVVGTEAEVIVPGGGGGIDVEDEGVAEATGATILNFTGAGVTATDVGGGQVDVDIPGAGSWALAGGAYTTPGVWDHAVDGNAANVDFTGLSGANDILIIVKAVTLSVSGRPQGHVSTDNGSTWYSTSGDYVTVSSAGVEAATTALIYTDTSATAARSGMAQISGANINGSPKLIFQHNSPSVTRLFVASNSPINATRIFPSAGGNITGGKIYCFIR